MRYLHPYIKKDLQKKMVFIGGPRQCGKTTLGQRILEEAPSGHYYNWDRDRDRRDLLKERWADTDRLLVFDELHKFKRWKNWLKGLYDTEKKNHQFLITGSARLDLYRRGGDSLLGRYHFWRLHPFTLSEIPSGIGTKTAFDRLLKVGGFPEPFLEGDEREARRWRQERYDRVLRDDVRDLENLRNISTVSLLLDLLRTRVGSPVVLANLAEDLQVSPVTVGKWVEILERMYLIFVVRPYTYNLARALQKPPKIYFFDNADVEENEGARFENLVATHLLKKIHFLQDRDGFRYELKYVRDKEKREVDFAILKDGKLEQLIEAKWAESEISKHLEYYADRLKPKRCSQIVGQIKRPYTKGRIYVESAIEVLRSMESENE